MENKVSLLYIGNEPEIIQYLSSSEEIDLFIQPNVLEANLYLAVSAHPNAILCDFWVPGCKNGIAFHEDFRTNKSFNQVAFLLVARQVNKELIKIAFRKNIDDFYALPLPPIEKFLSRVRFLNAYHLKYPFEPPHFIADVKYKMPFSKRLFDIVMATSALAFLSWLLLLVIMAIRLESKGKVYYISRRFGRIKPFDFYKLRSMRTGADKEQKTLAQEKNQYSGGSKRSKVDYLEPCPECEKRGDNNPCTSWSVDGKNKICEAWLTEQKRQIAVYQKISQDPRVTKVGKFIRNTSIDELPQLINVIKGDMSIVGNRPLPIYEADKLTTDTMSKRFLAPAGITGLWQVELRGKGGDMSEEERNQLDNEYAEHFEGNKYSFLYDLTLILRTFKALFQKDSV
ncbi:MAG: sugar transferase [Bacteroidota bacterium]